MGGGVGGEKKEGTKQEFGRGAGEAWAFIREVSVDFKRLNCLHF